jgi:hypothetical protein
MIRKRLTNTKRSEGESAQPQRRRISRIPSPSIPSDERDLSDDDLTAAKLAESFRAERARVRDAIRRAIGNDLRSRSRVEKPANERLGASSDAKRNDLTA